MKTTTIQTSHSIKAYYGEENGVIYVVAMNNDAAQVPAIKFLGVELNERGYGGKLDDGVDAVESFEEVYVAPTDMKELSECDWFSIWNPLLAHALNTNSYGLDIWHQHFASRYIKQ